MLQIEEDDGLPSNICEECLAMVEQTYLFKKKCKTSDSKLREHLELVELTEECKLNNIGFNDISDDHKLFQVYFLKELILNSSDYKTQLIVCD